MYESRFDVLKEKNRLRSKQPKLRSFWVQYRVPRRLYHFPFWGMRFPEMKSRHRKRWIFGFAYRAGFWDGAANAFGKGWRAGWAGWARSDPSMGFVFLSSLVPSITDFHSIKLFVLFIRLHPLHLELRVCTILNGIVGRVETIWCMCGMRHWFSARFKVFKGNEMCGKLI